MFNLGELSFTLISLAIVLSSHVPNFDLDDVLSLLLVSSVASSFVLEVSLPFFLSLFCVLLEFLDLAPQTPHNHTHGIFGMVRHNHHQSSITLVMHAAFHTQSLLKVFSN